MALLAVAGLATRAGAQPAPAPGEADRAAALALVREGNRLMDARQPAQALERFREAQRLVGGDKVRFNIGQALAALPGHEAEAYQELDLFVERVANAAPAVLRSAKGDRDRLRARVGFLRVATKPEQADIKIDGETAGMAPLAKPLVLQPGPHQLEVSAAGFLPYQGEVTLAAGQDLSQAVVLAPRAVATAPVQRAPEAAPAPMVGPAPTTTATTAGATVTTSASPAPARAPIYKKWWFWTAIGVAAGAVVLSTVALSGDGGVTHSCPPEAGPCQPLP